MAPIDGGPAQEAGVQNGDILIELGEVKDLAAFGKEREIRGWDVISTIISEFSAKHEKDENAAIQMRVRHKDGSEEAFAVSLAAPLSLGALFPYEPKTYIHKESSILGAFTLGMKRSMNIFIEIYRTLRGMLTGSVSSKNLGGPLAIFQVSRPLSQDMMQFLFFLGMLSLNLAFINVLPIPVLDGGHIFFLLIEAVKGSRVNEKVQGYSQMVGVLLVLALIVYVTMNDIKRFIFG